MNEFSWHVVGAVVAVPVVIAMLAFWIGMRMTGSWVWNTYWDAVDWWRRNRGGGKRP